MAECPGVYRLSLMRDGGLARIRIPGGSLTADQLHSVADVANTYGNGQIDLTNRANLQVRGLKTETAPHVEDVLRSCRLLCADPDTDRIRNITASPLAGIDESAASNVTPVVRALDKALQRLPSARDLSPKFAFLIDAGGQTGLANIGHDIGFLAPRQSQGIHFTISLAGHVTDFVVTATDLVAVSQAVCTYVTSAGHTRIKEVLTTRDPNAFINDVAQAAGIPLIPGTPTSSEPRPLPYGHHNGRSIETSWFCMGIPLARLNARQAHALAELSAAGNGTIRLTPWQSVVLPHISTDAAEDIGPQASSHGFDVTTPPIHVVACAGSTGCERTQADTKADGLRLIHTYRNRSRSTMTPRIIHIAGCPRGCAHPAISDVLALAGEGSANYALHAGSRPSTAPAKPPVMSNIPADELATNIDGLLKQG